MLAGTKKKLLLDMATYISKASLKDSESGDFEVKFEDDPHLYVINQLFSSVPQERISQFSCGHIIPSSNILGLAVTKGPSGVELEFKADKQKDPAAVRFRNSPLIHSGL